MGSYFVRVRFFMWGATASAIMFAAALVGAELPPEIQVDRLLVQAEREMEDGQHWSAVSTFDRILEFCEEHGLDIPTEFWFRHAGVLHSAGCTSAPSKRRPVTCRRPVGTGNTIALH